MADATRNLQMTTDAFRRGNYSSEDDGRNESEVMGNIHGYYKEAVDRLPSSLDPLVHEVGFSFGFFDPVSNIIANTSAAYGASSSSPVPAVEKEADREGQQGGRGKKRRRSQAGTRSKAKGKKMVSCESGGDATRQRGKLTCCAGASSIAARSLDGLVTFLTTYFRYLHTSEALRYLRLARADLLVAVRLIEEDRDSEAFTVHHPTTRVALTCAALSAMGDQVTGSDDPKVTGLVNSSLMLASRLSKVSPLLAIQGRLCSATLNQLFELSLEGTHGTADSDDGVIMLNAISRFPSSIKKTPYPFDLELVLTKVLQDRIHGFNLKAMSCIPAPCLRSRHHRSLLKAGHCYGPFDPITNIILNTIWYDTVFPPHQEFEVDVINYETLARTECRSLNGLITFVTELFPELSTYDATRYLLLHNGTLDSVISRANLDGYQTSADSHDAYEAAAYAANHPNPRALATFASGCMQEGLKLKSMLQVKHTLSPGDVGIISTCRCFHCELSGTKVVHPFSHAYLGQSFDFEEMARGEHSMTNNELVGDGGLRTVFLDTSEDDCIYFDPAWDADLSVRLNDDAKRELEGEDEASSRAKRRMAKEVARTMAAFIDSKETQMDASMG
ncbi:hypothetical protein HU200_022285 [Digitaria exilis]|uniref:PIR2-like helical domain-containing protein n=1 Tax=Digitaria exilis TaxID=1010633 RepID=A0A835EYS0_9POAL|nr:hypothetical protein HU200_022285 [Digitaria exilis]